MEYLKILNEKQREAAVHVDGPLLILAGAGSGKTATMTRRIAYLIQEKGISPYNILAVTFTNKAAREMRERVENLLGENVNVWILTFHSACLRILRKNAEKIGYSSDFTVYDPLDQKAVVKNAVKALNVNEKKFTPQYVLGIISGCKEKGITGSQYNKEYGDSFPYNVIGDLYRAYETTLKRNNAMDFDDLICNTVKLFEKDEETLEYYQNRFKYIMVDEYQDTNFMQYSVVKLLSQKHHNICVVGDDDQCIYQWRGADIRNILEFERDYKNTKVVKLEQNYRSYGNILAAAHSIIAHNKGRKQKKLWTDRNPGDKLKYFRAANEKEEARYIASEIDRLKTGERRYSDFAILYRTNAQSRNFEEALMAADIPYRVLGGTKYYDRKEIKDMLSYMRLVLNPVDDLSLIRIINEPKRGVGQKTIEKLQAVASLRRISIMDVLADDSVSESLSVKASAGIREMVNVVTEFHNGRDDLKVSDIYDGLLVRTGYLKALEDAKTVEADGRIENLLEFKSVIYDYEEEDGMMSLSEFLEKVALVADVDNHDASENAVALMTMHSAKGLEFPVVFMPGMEDGLFPGWRALDKADGIEEERRLCYVGITRAKEKLYLTSAEMRTLYGRTDYTRESQFLKELDRTLIDDASSEIGKSIMETGSSAYKAAAAKQPFSKTHNPFDQLKYIKQNNAAQNTSTTKQASGVIASPSIKDGDKIAHAKFGDGLVISVKDGVATIAFESVGIKKLSLAVAALEKK